MLQRAFLITGVALAGLAGFAFGDEERLAAALPYPGAGRVGLLLALCTILAVYAGAHGRWQRHLALHAGAMPALLTAGVFLCCRLALPVVTPARLIAALALALPAAIVADAQRQDGAQHDALSRAMWPLSVYAAALALFSGLHGLRLATPITMAGVGAAAAALTWFLLANLPDARRSDRRIASGVVGLVTAEAAWPLLYWPQPAFVIGLALLVVFYAASGIAQACVQDRTGRGVALEYALAGAAALALIIGAVLLAR